LPLPSHFTEFQHLCVVCVSVRAPTTKQMFLFFVLLSFLCGVNLSLSLSPSLSLPRALSRVSLAFVPCVCVWYGCISLSFSLVRVLSPTTTNAQKLTSHSLARPGSCARSNSHTNTYTRTFIRWRCALCEIQPVVCSLCETQLVSNSKDGQCCSMSHSLQYFFFLFCF
jgi:hypothetical protein